MLNNNELRSRIDHLLRENVAVREASEELVKEAERLRKEIDKHRSKERGKKPSIQREVTRPGRSSPGILSFRLPD
jgi:hypothetical protein